MDSDTTNMPKVNWDYSATSQVYSEDLSTPVTDRPAPTANATPSMELIYATLKQMQGEARQENRRAHQANKKLQSSIRKGSKMCSEMQERVTQVEARTSNLEDELGKMQEYKESQAKQAGEVMWKLEDFENRQRRNNLRFLGLEENSEGSDVRGFLVKLLKGAFPELSTWNWDTEIQRAHRFPLTVRKNYSTQQPEHPRAILVFFGNYLLRQAIFDKARPDAKRTHNGHTFFTRPDFCHITVERHWGLCHLISPFQSIGAEAYLLSPARLKIIYGGRVRVLTSEIKAQEYLKEIREMKRQGAPAGSAVAEK